MQRSQLFTFGYILLSLGHLHAACDSRSGTSGVIIIIHSFGLCEGRQRTDLILQRRKTGGLWGNWKEGYGKGDGGEEKQGD